MRKRKLFVLLLGIAFLVCSCASSGNFGGKHRSKRRCNCPTFSFHFSDEQNAVVGYSSAELS